MKHAAWWALAVAWALLAAAVVAARSDVARVRSDIRDVRDNVWCPKLYRGLRLEWSGETHLYSSTARTFSCRYTKEQQS